jgi:hypothetical protein
VNHLVILVYYEAFISFRNTEMERKDNAAKSFKGDFTYSRFTFDFGIKYAFLSFF